MAIQAHRHYRYFRPLSHTPTPFRVERHVDPDGVGVVVAPHGELDMATVDRVRAEVDDVLGAGTRAVVLDLRGVTFLDSTALSMLFAVHGAAARRGGELSVVNGNPRVSRLLDLTGAWRVLRRVDIGT